MKRFYNLSRQGIYLPYQRLVDLLNIKKQDELDNILKEMMTFFYREAKLYAGFLYLENVLYEYRYISSNVMEKLDYFLSNKEYTKAYILDACMNIAIMTSQDEDSKKLNDILDGYHQDILVKKEFPNQLSLEELKTILDKLSYYHKEDLKMNHQGIITPVKSLIFSYELGAGCQKKLKYNVHQCQKCTSKCEYRK